MSFLAKHFKVSNLDSYKTGLCESQIWVCNINTYFDTEAVVWRYSVKKKVLFKISQNSQENTCARDSGKCASL